jgi:hypothetical protein
LNTKKRNIDKAYKAMYAVLKKGRLHNLSIKCQYDLFDDKIVKPILLYGSGEILGFSNLHIRVITKLPNSVQSYKGKVKTHKYINRQN